MTFDANETKYFKEEIQGRDVANFKYFCNDWNQIYVAKIFFSDVNSYWKAPSKKECISFTCTWFYLTKAIHYHVFH